MQRTLGYWRGTYAGRLGHWRGGARESKRRAKSHISDPIQRIDQPLKAALEHGGIRLISVHWLLHGQPNFVSRNDLPEEAFVDTADAIDMMTSGERRIFASSHGWHGSDIGKGPDPTGARLKQSIAFFRWLLGHLPEQELKRYGYFIDWMCMWQGQRTPEQAAQFGEGLSVINLMFGSVRSTCLLVHANLIPRPPDYTGRWSDRPYDQRAWCMLEYHIGKLVVGYCSVVPTLRQSRHLVKKMYDISDVTATEWPPIENPAPGLPSEVAKNLEKLTTSNPADKALVVSMYMDTVRKLSFACDPQRQYTSVGFIATAQGLREAARFGAPVSDVEEILAEGVPPDEPDFSGMSALMEASLQGHTSIVDLLVSVGRGGGTSGGDGTSGESSDSRRNNNSMAVDLERTNEPPEGLVERDERKIDEKAVAQLYQKFKQLPKRWGYTPLLLACSEGHVKTAHRLLVAGARWLTFSSPSSSQRQSDPTDAMLGPFGRETLLAALALCDENEIIRGIAHAITDAPSTEAIVLSVLTRTEEIMSRAAALRASNPTGAESHLQLASRLQLAVSALIRQQAHEISSSNGVDDDGRPLFSESMVVDHVFQSRDGAAALDLAVRIDAKIFLSQPVVQEYLQRIWLGEVIHTATSAALHERYPLTSRTMLGLLLGVQLPLLLPLLAVWPPLERSLGASETFGRLFLLDAPFVKFYLSILSDVCLVLLYTFTPSKDLAHPYLGEGGGGYLFSSSAREEEDAADDTSCSLVATLLYVWIGTALLVEAQQARQRGLASYRSERFNWLDVSGLLFAMAGLLAAMTEAAAAAAAGGGGGGATATGADHGSGLSFFGIVRSDLGGIGRLGSSGGLGSGGSLLRALACLVLWLRVARLLLASATYGPFVLMVFRMLSDLTKFLVLEALLLVAYTSATYKLYERIQAESVTVVAAAGGAAAAEEAPSSEDPWDGEPSCDAEFSTFGRTLVLLWEGTLKSEGYFRCVQQSSHPEALAFMYTYVILTVVLMMNMLIAMMGKSFDVIWESAAATYLSGFAQTVLTFAEAPAAPLPIHILSLPYQLMRLCQQRCGGRGRRDGGGGDQTHPRQWDRLVDDDETTPATDPHDGHRGGKADGDRAPAPASAAPGGALSAEDVEGARGRLFDAMLEYVVEHEDDVAEEERWRTKMHKAFTEHFHALEKRTHSRHDQLRAILRGSSSSAATGAAGAAGKPVELYVRKVVRTPRRGEAQTGAAASSRGVCGSKAGPRVLASIDA